MKRYKNYGSKKKRRNIEYKEREKRRQKKGYRVKGLNDIMKDKNSTFEDIMEALKQWKITKVIVIMELRKAT